MADSAPPLKIYQIFYLAAHRPYLDPNAEPFDNQGVSHPLLEFDVFERIAAAHTDSDGMWGAVSWKFSEKTKLTIADLRTFIAKNPGHDVYYCNPFPANEALYHNMWQQGAVCHPNFVQLAEAFFKAARLDIRHLNTIQPTAVFAATNYHVGTARFWKSYLTFIRSALTRAEKNLDNETWALLTSAKADDKGVHAGACYLPFIVERLFSYWLHYIAPREGLSACKYPVASDELDVHLRTLMLLKDKAILEKSKLLAVSWINYRALYLSNSFGSIWARDTLKKVTPSVVEFDETLTC